MVDADLLIGTTSAPEPILDQANAFAPLHSKRNERVLLILDLAVPRDFDPAIGEMSGVYLYGIDDLQTACERNQRERQERVAQSKSRSSPKKVERFMQAIQPSRDRAGDSAIANASPRAETG